MKVGNDGCDYDNVFVLTSRENGELTVIGIADSDEGAEKMLKEYYGNYITVSRRTIQPEGSGSSPLRVTLTIKDDVLEVEDALNEESYKIPLSDLKINQVWKKRNQ
jgi:hypothetical protein